MRTLGWVLVVALLGGCHARFKKYVGSIDSVRPEVIVTTGPSVALGGVGDDSLVGDVVNVVQAVRSIDAAQHLSEVVDIQGVNQRFTEGLHDAIGSGPPFPVSDSPQAALLQVEVVDYGLKSPMMGVAGVFNYDLHLEIYLPGGKKVYNAHQSCSVGFGDASALSQAIGTVNNVKQLKDMSDREVQKTFENAAALCGQQVAMKIRKHASSNRVAPRVAGAPVEVWVLPVEVAAVIGGLETPEVAVDGSVSGL